MGGLGGEGRGWRGGERRKRRQQARREEVEKAKYIRIASPLGGLFPLLVVAARGRKPDEGVTPVVAALNGVSAAPPVIFREGQSRVCFLLDP